jgi:TonB family protein
VLPFLLVALLFHAGVIGWWETTDWPLKPLIDPMFLGDELVSVVPEPRWIEREEPERVGRWFDEDEDEWEELKENRPRSVDRKRNRVDEARKQLAGKSAERRAALLTELLAEAERQAGVIGSNAATAEVFGSGPTGADLERLIGDLAYGPATGHRSVLSGPAGGKGSGEVAEVDTLRLGGGDRVIETGGPGGERRVGRMRTAAPRSKPSAGFLDDAEVKRVVGRAKGAIKGCYERALPRDPTLEGRLEVHFTVSGSGRVSSVRIAGNELNEQVGRCVAAVFERLRFPEPKGGAASFTSPFFFTPAQ